MTMQTFTRDDERYDSRDLIEYRDALLEDDERDEDDDEIIAAINELAEDGIEDWEYGTHLIREDCFEAYAQELAEDFGAIDPDAGWPLHCIDWEQAARELSMDYTSVTFLGTSYYVR